MPTPQTKLAIQNAHPNDAFISFDEGPHIYTVHGQQGYTSVTTWIHQQFSHFDADKVIEGMVKRGSLQDPTNKYYGMTPEEIKTKWTKNGIEASGSGTKMHYDIECFYNDVPVVNDSIEYKYFENFRADFPELTAYRTEWMVYDEESKISGSIDMIFMLPDGSCQIYDWKRVREISYEDSFQGKMAKTDIIKHLPDTNFWHYSLQLSTYKYILEKNYGKKITGMYLVCMHPENPVGNYERIAVQDLSKEVAQMFSNRIQSLNSNANTLRIEIPELPTTPSWYQNIEPKTPRIKRKLSSFLQKEI